MLFNSFTFALFLPLVFFLYWFGFQKNLKLQNLFLLVSSYIFYGWWDWRFLTLIFISSLVDFFIGGLIFRNKHAGKRKFLLIISLLTNLGILGFFKYYNFFIDSLIAASDQMGIQMNTSTLHIILPVGISFYTFQTLSYAIDVYKKKIKPTSDVVAFFAFVSFFPQLVAGPIERASNLLPQFNLKRSFNNELAKDGLRQILWGLIKKVVVADTLAIQVDQIFNAANYNSTPGITLFFGAIFFSFQIYCDFSGYSDIAIGVARLFGFRLMRNFAFPFFSRNIGEFWQRWHISLSTWFRDYVFIPLGGSKVVLWKQLRNIAITYGLSGLWHGANWTFIVWGLLHALFYFPLLFLRNKGKFSEIVAQKRLFPSIKESGQMILTFFAFTFSMIFFRSDSMSRAFSYFQKMIINLDIKTDVLFSWLVSESFIILILLTVVEWLQRDKQHPMEVQHYTKPTRWLIYAISMIVFIYFGKFQSNQQFIYFQF